MSSPVPPSGAAPLSAHERDVLAGVTSAERRADPRFAADLAAGRVRDPAGRSPRRVAVLGAVLVAGVLVGLLATVSPALGVALAVVVAVTAGLVGWACAQERPRC